MKNNYQFNSPEELIEDIRQGKIVILVDDEDRENEGDLVFAADHVDAEKINFMAKEARGLICLALSSEQIEKLKLPLMVREENNYSSNKTAFTVSIEASEGVSTGISAKDRAHTVWVASRPEAKDTDVHMPGHIFPIRAKNGGVLKRAGHTEGSVDLAKLAGLNPAAVICEVMKDDGSMARVPDLIEFAKRHGLKIGTIVDLIEYRLAREILVEQIEEFDLGESFHQFKAKIFKSKIDGVEHLVLQKGEIDFSYETVVRVQLDSYSKDIFSVLKDGQSFAQHALDYLKKSDSGLFLLLRGNNKSVGLKNDIQQLLGKKEKVEMDSRDYGIGAQILKLLGVKKIKLLSNRLDRMVGLKAYDLEITELISLSDYIKDIGLSKNNIDKKNGDSHENRSGHLEI